MTTNMKPKFIGIIACLLLAGCALGQTQPPKTPPQLPRVTSLGSNDLVVIEVMGPNGTNSTRTIITGSMLESLKALPNWPASGGGSGGPTNLSPWLTPINGNQQPLTNASTVQANNFIGDASLETNGNASTFFSSGTIPNGRLSGNVTLQGNLFNGASQLLQADSSDRFPGLDGSLILALNASQLSSGTVPNGRLNASVTLQGNTFNGASQLLQLDSSDRYPALDGSQITLLNASQLASGTVPLARLPAIPESQITSLQSDLSSKAGTNDNRPLVFNSPTNWLGTIAGLTNLWGFGTLIFTNQGTGNALVWDGFNLKAYGGTNIYWAINAVFTGGVSASNGLFVLGGFQSVGGAVRSMQGGSGASAIGIDSIGWGTGATAGGNSSMAFGLNATANGTDSSAFGDGASTGNSTHAIAFGDTSSSAGSGAAYGSGASAGQFGTAFGNGASSAGFTSSGAFGNGATVTANHQLMWGTPSEYVWAAGPVSDGGHTNRTLTPLRLTGTDANGGDMSYIVDSPLSLSGGHVVLSGGGSATNAISTVSSNGVAIGTTVTNLDFFNTGVVYPWVTNRNGHIDLSFVFGTFTSATLAAALSDENGAGKILMDAGDGGQLTHLNRGASTGGVATITFDASALGTNSTLTPGNWTTITCGAGSGALQGNAASFFPFAWPISNAGTNQWELQWTPPASYPGTPITVSFMLLSATNATTQTTNVFSVAASANGAALGTPVTVTNLLPVSTGFISTNIVCQNVVVSGMPAAKTPISWQFQSWGGSPFWKMTNNAWIMSMTLSWTNTSTQNALLSNL